MPTATKPLDQMSKRELSIVYYDHDIEIIRILPFICAGNSDNQADSWRELLEDNLDDVDLLAIFRTLNIISKEDEENSDDIDAARLADAIGEAGLTGFLVEYSSPVMSLKKDHEGKEWFTGNRGSVYHHWLYMEELNQTGLAFIAQKALEDRETQIASLRKKTKK